MAFIFENGTMTFNNPIIRDDRASDLPLDDSGDVRILYMHDDKKIAETGFNFTKTCTIGDSPMGSTMICHNWMSFVKWIPDVEGADKIIFKWNDKILQEVKLVEKLSPLQQIANGILPENVVCSDGMVLVKKSFENSVVCVKPQTAQKLVERGWGALVTQSTLVNSQSICEANGGTWDEKYRECYAMNLSSQTCKALNGTYEFCDSPCRHIPNGENLGCTAVCVQVCTVK